MPSLQLLVLFAWGLLQQTVVSMPQTLVQVPAPVPALNGPSSTATLSSCFGCYLVADVVGLVWYSEILEPVVGTQIVSVAVGNGTSRATSTVFTSAEVEFTYTPGGPAPTDGAAFLNFGTTYEIAGHTLTSPTAYNVYSAYTIMSSYMADGTCVTTQKAVSTLATGFTQILSTASREVYLNAQGEQSFINSLGFSSCSGGSAAVNIRSLIQVNPTILTTTQSYASVSLSAASRTLPPTTKPTKTSRTSITSLSTTVITSNSSTISSTISRTLTPIVTPKPVYHTVSPPVLVLNSTTLTLKSTLFPYPIENASSITETLAVVIPSGTGAGSGNYTAIVYPGHSSQGIRSWRSLGSWTAVWATGAVGLSAAFWFL